MITFLHQRRLTVTLLEESRSLYQNIPTDEEAKKALNKEMNKSLCTPDVPLWSPYLSV